MLFANVYSYKDSLRELPPARFAEVGAASLAFIDKYRKLGNLKNTYRFADATGGISIWEFASGEEMHHVIRESPVYAFTDQELIPLVEPQVSRQITEDLTEAARKAAKKLSKK
jgi:hypothetical protein